MLTEHDFVEHVIRDNIYWKSLEYVKGFRLHDPENLRQMPKVRLLGNIMLSFLTKLVSGYWNVFDSTSGYTAA